jgi:hypothetical protein
MAAAATRMMADLNSTPTSQVRVGVRIRPLTPKESSEGGKVVLNGKHRLLLIIFVVA